MDASKLPKGISTERTDGKPQNEPGIYIHRDTKQKFITAPGNDGVIMADALMSPVWRDAWYRAADVPSATELHEARKYQEKKDAEAEKTEVTAEVK